VLHQGCCTERDGFTPTAGKPDWMSLQALSNDILGEFVIVIIIIFIFLHGLGRLTCSGIDALPSFPGASTISSSSGFVVEGVIRQSVVIHSLKVVDPILFVFGSYILYSRDL